MLKLETIKKTIIAMLLLSASVLVMMLTTGCEGDTTITDSYNVTNNTDSFNTYTAAEKEIIADGYVPDTAGVCSVGYSWCSDVKKCLPIASDGSVCSVHTDEEEAELAEINEGA